MRAHLTFRFLRRESLAEAINLCPIHRKSIEMLIICYLYSSLLSVFSLLLPSLFRLISYIFGWDGNKCNVVFLNERMAIFLKRVM